ncbi:hypothetical protein [Usitatibacter palustris]|uniref:DUF2946 domain-containing protein n=1 Tax=Usitatibacter palustris TaxID=2732487 RepID=A0A6M4H8I0_9PROT|nr:hypothetical protein [Usitatibacter palustris]QJR16019.1 hypothetical protein DSM104440_02847 [Usitatibacter palustris]
MARSRPYLFAWLLAFLLAFAQQAAFLHGLGHASEQIQGHEQPGKPLDKKCDTHFLCAELGSAAPAALAPVPPAERSNLPPSFHHTTEALPSARLAFHSRAPPA